MPDGRDLEVKLEQEETVPSWDDEDQRVDADFRSVAGKLQLPKLVREPGLSSGARINGRNVRQTRSNDRRGPDAGLVQLHAYTYLQHGQSVQQSADKKNPDAKIRQQGTVQGACWDGSETDKWSSHRGESFTNNFNNRASNINMNSACRVPMNDLTIMRSSPIDAHGMHVIQTCEA
ncbi:uncharacterized protein FPRO_00257 [Fusarium proliferatum ET1]|uniref:Uncharacterized protein n=1 Tax=Fusarium proliferatum (strain ET1) TaxID=1227346 RepID=A0A1L7V8J5_FUSPR|nr:uncharacterized protein FPRO_00257 [Fusarium proliferatum ET1]CZR35620.1 uncharacterized protein FPRO_00257 [Fusarium proliferatum ET1]